jgi:ethanolamine utilization protein EutN
MFIAKVVGNMWATRKIKALEGMRLLLFQAFDSSTNKTKGKVMMAVAHTIDAGVGDTVIIMDEGSSAKDHLGFGPTPIRTFIFAIVDQECRGGETTRYS